MPGQIFISYRRKDSQGITGRIYDRLLPHFSKEQLFIDIDTIPYGADFVEVIEDAVSQCDILIVIIGDRWVNLMDKNNIRLLHKPNDFVRLEIASALKRQIVVIPVLVDNAQMPNPEDLPDDLKPLLRRNAIEIVHNRFHSDSERLISAVKKTLAQNSEWNDLVKKQKVELFEEYLINNPHGRFRTDCMLEISKINTLDEQHWNEVNNSNSLDLLNNYISRFPKGKFKAVCQTQIKNLVEYEQRRQQMNTIAPKQDERLPTQSNEIAERAPEKLLNDDKNKIEHEHIEKSTAKHQGELNDFKNTLSEDDSTSIPGLVHGSEDSTLGIYKTTSYETGNSKEEYKSKYRGIKWLNPKISLSVIGIIMVATIVTFLVYRYNHTSHLDSLISAEALASAGRIVDSIRLSCDKSLTSLVIVDNDTLRSIYNRARKYDSSNNYVEELKWLQKGLAFCKPGNNLFGSFLYSYGYLYYKGWGVDSDRKRAYDMFTMAVKNGLPGAVCEISYMHYGDKQDDWWRECQMYTQHEY